jgi:hypothetical protein
MVSLSVELDSVEKVYSQNLATVTYDYMGLDKYDLVHDSDLIVLGRVLDQNSAGMVKQLQGGVAGNLTELPGIRNTIEVEEIIKGSSGNKTVDVITEDDLSGNIVVEGPAKFQKGERSLLFLNREKLYAGEYTTMGGEQGKFPVNSDGLVKSKQLASGEYWPVNATSIANFEGEIKNILAEPRPEKISEDVAPEDRDLTTEEIEALERNSTGG